LFIPNGKPRKGKENKKKEESKRKTNQARIEKQGMLSLACGEGEKNA